MHGREGSRVWERRGEEANGGRLRGGERGGEIDKEGERGAERAGDRGAERGLESRGKRGKDRVVELGRRVETAGEWEERGEE